VETGWSVPEPLNPTIASVSPALSSKLTFLSVGSELFGYVYDKSLRNGANIYISMLGLT
jgi:hypothetical protein